VAQTEAGDPGAWKRFASYRTLVDGEYAETYAVACAELAARDPTFYLRRYLLGDLSAIRCAWEGYWWAGDRRRSLLDATYAERLYIAANSQERRKIETFIKRTTQRTRP